MSLADFFAEKQRFVDWQNENFANPRAWIIIANPVWGRCETVNRIAIFDTREQAETYVRESCLPEGGVKGADGIYRTYRSDSLLYDYNPRAGVPGEEDSRMVFPLLPWHDVEALAQNPVLPLQVPAEMPPLEHARYGVNYDVGFGPPSTESVSVVGGTLLIERERGEYTNMDAEVPQLPMAASGRR